MRQLLDDAWRRRFDAVRSLLDRLVLLLDTMEAPAEFRTRARQAAEGLDQVFLVVVSGEFNAGKSALVNALLGGPYLEEGVTPTTREVQVLEQTVDDSAGSSDGILHRAVPAELLRDLRIVDTPGTNAILREHEALTRDYVPRADLVLFVTSADRPFSETERAFLDVIHGWGKPIVFVVNKMDLLEEPGDREEVLSFVETNARQLVGDRPTVFGVSARLALRAKRDGAPVSEGWSDFETWFRTSLTEQARLRLKVLSPLGVADRLAETLVDEAAIRLRVLEADRAVLGQIEDALAVFRDDMLAQFIHRMDTVDAEIMRLRERGEAFLENRFQIRRLRELANSDRLRSDFERDVVGATPVAIEREIADLVDWIIDREHEQWQAIRERLLERGETDALRGAARHGSEGFAARRAALLAGVAAQAERVVDRFDPSAESARLVTDVRDAMAGTALAEVGALGLGIILKILLTTAVADATGILAAGVLAALGLTIIPYRRRKAIQSLRERTATLRQELRDVLDEAVRRELNASVDRMHGAVAPYGRFVRAESERLESATDELETVRREAADIKRQVPAAGSGE